MNYLSVENTSKILSDKVLFSDLTFGLEKGEKVAFIARNGAGKSSLLRILAARDSGDTGKVVVRNGIHIGYLEQHPEFNQHVSIQDYIENSHSEVFTILREYQKAVDEQSAEFNEKTHAAFELTSRKMDQFHAWDYERKLKELLDRFRIIDLSQMVNTLSGVFTYALWWVRSEIRRYLSKNQNLISLPDIFYNDYLNFKKAYFKLSKKLKRHPSENELAEVLQIPEKKVKVMLAVPDEIISLDKGISDDNSSSLTTFLPDDSVIDPQDILIGITVRDLVREDIERLTAREAEIIRLRYGFQGEEPQKLREIAKQLKMSPEGIRRIEIKALAKLKNQLKMQGIYGALN